MGILWSFVNMSLASVATMIILDASMIRRRPHKVLLQRAAGTKVTKLSGTMMKKLVPFCRIKDFNVSFLLSSFFTTI